MPPKGSKSSKTVPNQHDKRHESGLAPPGKRVVKQRSNGQLDAATAPGKSTASVLPPQLPSTGLNQGLKYPRPTDNLAENGLGSVARDYASAIEGGERERTSSDASLEEIGGYLEAADNFLDQFFPAATDSSAAAGKS